MRLIVDGVDVAPLRCATSSWQKMKGLLGHSAIDGAMFFKDVPSVHTFFMRFAIDVAFVDSDLLARHVQTMKPFRISGKHRHIRHVLEAQAGAFETWNLHVGSTLEMRP